MPSTPLPPISLESEDNILPALAQTLAEYVDGIGRVYDQTADDPTPDEVTILSNGKPVCIFIDPRNIQYDTQGTQGYQGETRTRNTITCVLLFGSLETKKGGTLQRRARPFARYRVADAIRQHNTLGHKVWLARVASCSGGQIEWGTVTYYGLQFEIIVDDDRDVTPGSD